MPCAERTRLCKNLPIEINRYYANDHENNEEQGSRDKLLVQVAKRQEDVANSSALSSCGCVTWTTSCPGHPVLNVSVISTAQVLIK